MNNNSKRPIAPHFAGGVFKMPISGFLSFAQRATGMALFVGVLMSTIWIFSAFMGENAYNLVVSFLGSWFGQLCLLGWSFCLLYHWANGIRHMFWDIGIGLEFPTIDKSGWFVLGFAGITTVIYWIVLYTIS